MKFSVATCLAAVLVTALPVMADQKAPKPKNAKELAALQAWQAAEQSGDPDKELAAITNVLENFADTDFKPLLLSDAMRAAQQKRDLGLVLTWTQRAQAEDPNNIEAHVVLAETKASQTRPNDLDKADSIKMVQTNANQALALLKSATAPPPGVTDAQWVKMKTQLGGEAYDSLAKAALADGKPADEVSAYKSAMAMDPSSATWKAGLSKAYVDNKQYAEAIATAKEVIDDKDANPQVKQFAQVQMDNATRMKGK